ncbi:MAG: TraB/GumN family protein [Proteobacteria bacterium]|nr:TraB/GumN family protein [Pseudomonadota bacterium]
MGRKALGWFLALGLFGGLEAQGASPVWAVSGAHNTVYLAGSVHLLPVGDAQLPRGFEHAYADSKQLVMEMDLAKVNPVEMTSWMMDHSALPAGTTLHGVLGDARYERVRTAATKAGLSMDGLDHVAPWMVGLEITDSAYLQEGFDPDDGVEEQLLRRAQADGRPTGGLETLEEELGGLAALPQADQIHMLDQTLGELADLKSEMADVVGAWRRGDAAKLGALLSTEYREFPALYKPLVLERNERWVPQIETLLNGRENVLVVVGALHVVGDGGLLERLRRKGYRITQLD